MKCSLAGFEFFTKDGYFKKKITVLQYDTNKDKLWLRFIAFKENTC